MANFLQQTSKYKNRHKGGKKDGVTHRKVRYNALVLCNKLCFLCNTLFLENTPRETQGLPSLDHTSTSYPQATADSALPSVLCKPKSHKTNIILKDKELRHQDIRWFIWDHMEAAVSWPDDFSTRTSLPFSGPQTPDRQQRSLISYSTMRAEHWHSLSHTDSQIIYCRFIKARAKSAASSFWLPNSGSTERKIQLPLSSARASPQLLHREFFTPLKPQTTNPVVFPFLLGRKRNQSTTRSNTRASPRRGRRRGRKGQRDTSLLQQQQDVTSIILYVQSLEWVSTLPVHLSSLK